MKIFREIINVINEGGNAVQNVVRINQENTMATVDDVYKKFLPKLKIKKQDFALLGSTGKKAPKESSGDIDMAVSAIELLKQSGVDTYDDMMDSLLKVIKGYGYDYKDMRSLGIVSFAFPIVNVDGLQGGEKVQVDFMIVKDVTYAVWAYYSPHYLDSELKGLYRNFLNFNVARFADLKVDKIDPDTNLPVEWSRYWLTNNDGLQFGRQTNLSPKTGKITKTLRPIEKKTVTMNPDEIVAFLYGEKYKAKDLLTFEACLKAILSNNFPYKNQRNVILKGTAETLQNEGYPVPDALENAIK